MLTSIDGSFCLCLPLSWELEDIIGRFVRCSSNRSFRLSSVIVSALAMFLGIRSAVSLQITCASL